MNVCPDDIFWTTEHFVSKPGMVVQPNGGKLDCCFQGQITVKVKTLLNLYVSYVFCATDLLATKGVLICYS